MSRSRVICFCAAILAIAVLGGAPILSSAGADQTRLAGSVVSLLAPAHGTAFSFGRAGHLLTTRRAVGQATSVRLVTGGGQSELAAVVDTSNPAIVQLHGSLTLGAFHGGPDGRGGDAVSIVSGPLNSMRVEAGLIRNHRGDTTIKAAAAFEGSPVLNSAGRVIGVSNANGARIAILPIAGLRPLPMAEHPRKKEDKASPSLVPWIALLLAFGVGVGLARVYVRSRTTGWLERRQLARYTPQPDRAQVTPGRPGPRTRLNDEPDTDVHVVLRPREPEEPPPDVRLRRRPHEDDDVGGARASRSESAGRREGAGDL